VYFNAALAAVRVSSPYQRVLKHYAHTQTVYIKLTIAQVDFTASQQTKLPKSQQAFLKEYHNNDFEMVVRISKHLEDVLKKRYGAQGHGLGKISTTNTNILVLVVDSNLDTESEINQFEFINKQQVKTVLEKE